jgi:ABC-type dipeptide/oligopeptide/nickel transport system ATPase component
MAFKKAVKYNSRLRLALAGPSGSGKTYTALTIATALAGDGEVAVIDTERGSASKYADCFLFDVQELESFHPNNYINAIHEAEAAGYAVLVIDSLSHAWNGPGGLLEQVENITKRSKSGSSFNAWGEATPLQNRLIDTITRSKLHIICTMRTKTEYVIEPNAYGKSAPRKVGTAPVQRADVEYEFDVYGDMDIDNTLVIHKSRCSELASAVIAKPDSEVAEVLKRWLDGVPAPERPLTVKDAYEHCFSLGLVKVKAEFYQYASEIMGVPVTAENVMTLSQDSLKIIVASTQEQQTA